MKHVVNAYCVPHTTLGSGAQEVSSQSQLLDGSLCAQFLPFPLDWKISEERDDTHFYPLLRMPHAVPTPYTLANR